MARDQRTAQCRIEVEQVARAAGDVGLGAAQVLLQHAQVVLGGVDGGRRIVWRRPRQARAAALLRRADQRLVAGHPPGHGALQVDGVERRHARARLRRLHRGVGGDQRPRRGTGGQPQLQTLGGHAILVGGQIGRQRLALAVEQQRILAAALREHPLGEPEHADDVEGAGAHLIRRADEHAAVAMRRRRHRQVRQPVAQHVAHFGQPDVGDAGERLQFGERGQHAVRAGEHPRRQPLQPRDPAAPVVGGRPRRHLPDDVAGKRDEFVGPGDLAGQRLVPRRTRIVLERRVGAHLAAARGGRAAGAPSDRRRQSPGHR